MVLVTRRRFGRARALGRAACGGAAVTGLAFALAGSACSPFEGAEGGGAPADAGAGAADGASGTDAPSIPGGAGYACAEARRAAAPGLVACEDFEEPPAALPGRFAPEVDGDMAAGVAVVAGRGLEGSRGLRVLFDRSSGQKGNAAWGTRAATLPAGALELAATVTFDRAPSPTDFAYLVDLELLVPEGLLFAVRLSDEHLVAIVGKAATILGEADLGPVAPDVPTRVAVSVARRGALLEASVMRDGEAHSLAPVDLGGGDVQATHAKVGAFYLTTQAMRFGASFDDVVLQARP